jgi:predicted CXXCH cytochrome family protein
MQNASFLKLRSEKMRGSGCARCLPVRMAHPLILLILLSGLFSAGNLLFAQEAKPQAKSKPAVKPHDPLDGKECSDCHRRVASTKVSCLLAKEDLCEFCHQVPAQGGPTRLLKTPEPLCFKCHKKDQFKGSYVHGPFAAGACITCHDPHGGNVPGMLRVTGREMCLDCHENIAERLVKARFQHEAAATECVDCHSPHLSEQRYMLKSAYPGLCGKCHEKTVKDMQTAVVKHSPVTEDAACMNCHEPHAAQESNLLLEDGLDICLKCHDKPVKTEKQVFADMKKLLAENPYWHDGIRNRYCSACHNPHGSPYFQSLKNQYSPNFYAPFFISNYDLCFRCHDSSLVTKEQTTSATEFRDGDRNLHFVHVDKESHGRTCRSCHDVHASTTPQLIGTTVPFGTWKLPINFEKTKNGGSCTPGCHEVKKYDRQAAKQGQQ